MDKPMNNIAFRLMDLEFRLRDQFTSPRKILAEPGLKPGDQVLDYGCGPGGFSVAAARMVQPGGLVYALDIHPLAIGRVRARAAGAGLGNIETIQSDCKTGLTDCCIDVALLYDTYHDLSEPENVLREIHRVLKAGGRLSFSDHHLKDDEIVSHVPTGGLFRLSDRHPKTYTFVKA